MRTQVNIEMLSHEAELMKADAREMGFKVNQLVPLLWRMWRAEGRKIVFIPPYPEPAKDTAKESAK